MIQKNYCWLWVIRYLLWVIIFIVLLMAVDSGVWIIDFGIQNMRYEIWYILFCMSNRLLNT